MPEAPVTATALTIRRATTRDAAEFARSMGNPGVYPGLMQLPFPSDEMWLARLSENNSPAKSNDLVLVAERDGRLCGSSGLHMAPPLRRRHVAHLGISVSAEAQGQGVGTALMAAMCDFADNWAQILRIELTVFSDNDRAIGLYRRFGFVHEGTHRKYAIRLGVFCVVFSLARLHPKPPDIGA